MVSIEVATFEMPCTETIKRPPERLWTSDMHAAETSHRKNRLKNFKKQFMQTEQLSSEKCVWLWRVSMAAFVKSSHIKIKVVSQNIHM